MFSQKITPLYSGMAVYWGTFDPVTQAHFDIIKQALESNFEKVIVAINDNKSTGKVYKSPGDARLEMLKIMRADEKFGIGCKVYDLNPPPKSYGR